MNDVLTLSGNEITDFERRQAILWGTTQQGGSTDGVAVPGGLGIWEAGTNLFRRGQCDAANADSVTGASGGGLSLAVDATTPAPFSPQSIKVSTNSGAPNQGIQMFSATGQTAAAGTAGVGSVYFKGVTGNSYTVQLIWSNTDASSTFGTATTFNATGGWQPLTPALVAVAAGKTGDQFQIRVQLNGTRTESFWVAHAMLQKGVNVASPYVATSGGATATRNAARMQAPASLLTANQGWIAARVRMGWASNAGPGGGAGLECVVDWNTGVGTNRLLVQYSESAQSWRVARQAGVDAGYLSVAGTFNIGDSITVVAAWDAGNIYLSVNGSAFVSSANATIPVGLAALFDIASQAAVNFLDSTVQWFACGTGTLTDADAAAISSIPSSQPPHAYIPDDAQITGSWPLWGHVPDAVLLN